MAAAAGSGRGRVGAHAAAAAARAKRGATKRARWRRCCGHCCVEMEGRARPRTPLATKVAVLAQTLHAMNALARLAGQPCTAAGRRLLSVVAW